MTRPVPLILGLLGLCGALLVWFLRDDSAVAPPAVVPPAGIGAERPEPAAWSAGADAEGGESRAPIETSSERTPFAVDPNAVSTGPILRVVEAATGEALPGAEVFVGDDRSRQNRRGRSDRGAAAWISRLEETVRPLRADAQGEVTLLPIERRIIVVARAPGLLGVGSFDRDAPARVELRLAVDQTVTVRVSGPRGEPRAGVGVALCADRQTDLSRRASSTTDDDGYAVFRHVQLSRVKLAPANQALQARRREVATRTQDLDQTFRMISAQMRSGDRSVRQQWQRLAEMRQRNNAERRLVEEQWRVHRRDARQQMVGPARASLPDADFVVLAEVPQQVATRARFSAASPPTDPIELRLGSIGSVVVRLSGPGGKPLATEGDVVVRASEGAAVPGADPVAVGLAKSERQITRQSRKKALQNAEVRFSTVGTGVPFDVLVRFEDDDFDFAQTGLAGLSAGEERVVELAVPEWFTVLTGRLVDEAGAPAGALRPQMLVTGAAGRIEAETLRTTADGRFELPLRLQRPAPPYQLEIKIERDERRSGARIELPTLVSGRRHELGDVSIGLLPTLAHGVVRDDRGEPVRGARVDLQTFLAAAGKAGDWRSVSTVGTRSDREGAYRLFGVDRALPMRLQVRARGHATATVDVAFGAETNVVLRRLARLSGRGQVPEWMPRGAARVQLWAGARRVRDTEVRRRGDGSFRFQMRDVDPGTYDLRVVLRGVPRPLFRLAGLVLPAGADVADPRLQQIDLRSTLFRYVVRAFDQNGNAVRSSSPLLARLADDLGQIRQVAFPWRGASVEFFASDPSVEVHALAPGHRPVRAVVVPGENRVTLRRLFPVRLQLTGLRARVGKERRVRVSMVRRGVTALPDADMQAMDQRNGSTRRVPRAMVGKSGGAWLGENDTVRIALMMDGNYDVVVRVYDPAFRSAVSKTIGTVSVALDGAEPELIPVAVPADLGLGK